MSRRMLWLRFAGYAASIVLGSMLLGRLRQHYPHAWFDWRSWALSFAYGLWMGCTFYLINRLTGASRP